MQSRTLPSPRDIVSSPIESAFVSACSIARSASRPSSTSKNETGGNAGRGPRGGAGPPWGATFASLASVYIPRSRASSASRLASSASAASSSARAAAYAASLLLRAATTRSARFCSATRNASERTSRRRYDSGATRVISSDASASFRNASSTARFDASDSFGYSMICRNTKTFFETFATSFPIKVVSSTAAMRGTRSVAGAAGNCGTEGVRRLGTARGPSFGIFGSLALGTGTCVGAGGAGAGLSGVRNVWLTAPEPASAPATGAASAAQDASARRSARYDAKARSESTSKYSSWSGYATNTRGGTSGAFTTTTGGGSSTITVVASVAVVAEEGSAATGEFSPTGDAAAVAAAAASSGDGVFSSSPPAFFCSSVPPSSPSSVPSSGSSGGGGGGGGSSSANAHAARNSCARATKAAGVAGLISFSPESSGSGSASWSSPTHARDAEGPSPSSVATLAPPTLGSASREALFSFLNGTKPISLRRAASSTKRRAPRRRSKMNAPSTSGSPAPMSPTPRRSPSGVAAARRARFARARGERPSEVFPSPSSPGTNATSPATSAQIAPSDPFVPNVAHATPSASTETDPTPRSAAMSRVTASACVGAKPSFSTRHKHPAGTSRHTRVPSACTANDRDPDAASGCSTTSVRSSRLVTLARVSGSITVAADRGRTNVGGGVTTSPALHGTEVGPDGSVV